MKLILIELMFIFKQNSVKLKKKYFSKYIPVEIILCSEISDGPDRADLNVPENYVITEGDPEGRLTCSSECYPNCSYQWTKDSAPVGSGGIIQLGTATRQQAGNYTCTARNTASQYARLLENSTNVIVRCTSL